tara:strand:- start:249 stop:431 length:183 start_codon:yes stop_codon:yes gene_type:complete
MKIKDYLKEIFTEDLAVESVSLKQDDDGHTLILFCRGKKITIEEEKVEEKEDVFTQEGIK